MFSKSENKTINLIISSFQSALTDIWEGTLKKENFKPQVIFWLTISVIYLIDTIVLQGFGFCIDDYEIIKQYRKLSITNSEQGIKFTLFTVGMGIVCSYINLLLFSWMKHFDEPSDSIRMPGYNFSRSHRFVYYLILFLGLGYLGSFIMSILAHDTINLNNGILFGFGNFNNINFATPLRQMPECLIIMWSFLGFDFYLKSIKGQMEWRDKMRENEIERENQKLEMKKEEMRIKVDRVRFALQDGENKKITKENEKIQYEKEKLEEENKKQAMRLQMFQSRMKPHSLVNILSTVFESVDSVDKKASILIEKFSNLIRYVLEISDEKIEKDTLKKEVEHLIDLVAFKALYNNDLEVTTEISERVREEDLLMIEKGILDEFVLNAFKYGLVDKGSGRKPSVAIELKIDDENCLSMTVINTTLIRNTLKGEKIVSHTHSSGKGLEIVKNRLEEHYPNGKYELLTYHFKHEGWHQIKLKIELNNEK